MFIGKDTIQIAGEVFTKLESFIALQQKRSGDISLAKMRTEILDAVEDKPTADDDRCMFDLGRDIGLSVVGLVGKAFPENCVNPSGHWHYPVGGFMGWHTNSDAPFERLYLVYSETGESWFRYRDPVTSEIVSVQDNKGWNVYNFTTPNDQLFWHCVYSECNRFSFGFRIV